MVIFASAALASLTNIVMVTTTAVRYRIVASQGTLSFRDGPKDQTRNLELPGSFRFATRPGMTANITATKSSCDIPDRSTAAPPAPGETPRRAPARTPGRPAPAPDRDCARRSRSRCAGATDQTP